MKRPRDKFYETKIKIIDDEWEEYINDLEYQRRCPFFTINSKMKCVYLTNSKCQDHSVCPGNGDAYCNQLNDLKAVCKDILLLIGNVDHSIGNGPRSAKTRGDLLNDFRKMLTEYIPEDPPEDDF